MDDLWTRAWAYYRRNGWQRSMMMLRRKWLGTAPVRSSQYVKVFGAVGGPAASREAAPPVLAGEVAIIGDLNLPQCKKYRVIQKMETLEDLGVTAAHASFGDVKRSLDLMQASSSVIFYRLQDNAAFRALLAEARRLGLPVGYDLDDPLFDRGVYGENPNLAFLAKAERDALLAAAPRYRAAIAACDFAIASTPAMADLMGPIVSKVFLWRNAVDAETMHWAEVATRQTQGAQHEGVVLAYASGSRAHEADFRVAEAALVKTLERFPQARLLVIGHLHLPHALRRFEGRVHHSAFASYGDYLGAMRRADINLVPLVADRFNACKSAIRFLDAAVLGVPTIASRTGDFIEAVTDGHNGFLASDEEAWLKSLECLIGDSAERRRMGEEARRAAVARFSTAAIGQALDGDLLALLRGQAHG